MLFPDKKSNLIFGIFALFILSIGFGSGYLLVKNVVLEQYGSQLGLKPESIVSPITENSNKTSLSNTNSIVVPLESPILETGSTEERVTFVLDALDALKLYYLASIETDPQYYPGYPDSQPEALYITKAVENIKTADAKLNKYVNFKNDNINFVVKQMLEGSQIVISSVDLFLDARRKFENNIISEQEAQKEAAESFDWQRVGFGAIALVTQINLDSVFIEFRKVEERTGAITYKITKEQRMTILSKIEELFGKELLEEEKSRHQNPILILGVNGLKASLSFETYEEWGSGGL